MSEYIEVFCFYCGAKFRIYFGKREIPCHAPMVNQKKNRKNPKYVWCKGSGGSIRR